MADSRPCTSDRAEVSEKERQLLAAGMLAYVQPMAMYRCVQKRQQSQVGLRGVHPEPASKGPAVPDMAAFAVGFVFEKKSDLSQAKDAAQSAEVGQHKANVSA